MNAAIYEKKLPSLGVVQAQVVQLSFSNLNRNSEAVKTGSELSEKNQREIVVDT